MLSVVLDLPDNAEVLTRCLAMAAAHRPEGGVEVVVPWEGRPREVLPVLRAFSARLFWKLVVCPPGKGGSLPALPYAMGETPVVMSHRILLGPETLQALSVSLGRARIYLAENFPLQWDPYSFWLPAGYRESCRAHPFQTPEVVVEEPPLCANGEAWSSAEALLLPGSPFRAGEALATGEAVVISSTDKPSFPPDEDRL